MPYRQLVLVTGANSLSASVIHRAKKELPETATRFRKGIIKNPFLSTIKVEEKWIVKHTNCVYVAFVWNKKYPGAEY